MIVQPGRAFPANTPVPYGGGGAACRVGASLPPAGALTLSGACSHARTTPQARSEPSLQSTATPHHAVSCGDADTQHPTLHESRSPPARARYAAYSTPSGAPGRACRPFAAARTIHAISLLGTCTGCALPPPGRDAYAVPCPPSRDCMSSVHDGRDMLARSSGGKLAPRLWRCWLPRAL